MKTGVIVLGLLFAVLVAVLIAIVIINFKDRNNNDEPADNGSDMPEEYQPKESARREIRTESETRERSERIAEEKTHAPQVGVVEALNIHADKLNALSEKVYRILFNQGLFIGILAVVAGIIWTSSMSGDPVPVLTMTGSGLVWFLWGYGNACLARFVLYSLSLSYRSKAYLCEKANIILQK